MAEIERLGEKVYGVPWLLSHLGHESTAHAQTEIKVKVARIQKVRPGLI